MEENQWFSISEVLKHFIKDKRRRRNKDSSSDISG
jgi:hypothetical protein